MEGFILHYYSLAILAIAISIDGFVVGVTYGLKKIAIGIIPLLIISGISTMAIFITGNIGAVLATTMNEVLARNIGSIILVFMGLWMILNTYFEDFFNTHLKVIKILKEPVKADFDKSGSINIVEATFLGIALALDAVGAGLGVGFTGFNTFIVPIIIGIANLILVSSGYIFGNKIGDIMPSSFQVFPGIIIILLGIGRII